MQCGPCDESTRKPSAGVGFAAKDTDNIVVAQAQRNTTNFQNAWLAGRVGQYEVDLGWEANLVVYVFYGNSGGSAKDTAIAEEILGAI